MRTSKLLQRLLRSLRSMIFNPQKLHQFANFQDYPQTQQLLINTESFLSLLQRFKPGSKNSLRKRSRFCQRKKCLKNVKRFHMKPSNLSFSVSNSEFVFIRSDGNFSVCFLFFYFCSPAKSCLLLSSCKCFTIKAFREQGGITASHQQLLPQTKSQRRLDSDYTQTFFSTALRQEVDLMLRLLKTTSSDWEEKLHSGKRWDGR